MDSGVVANLYKMPAWNKTAYPNSFGFPDEAKMEVQPLTQDDIDKAFEAPSDWTFLLQYSFGPDNADLETKSDLKWYTQNDDEKVKRLWTPTNTYFQPFINCTADGDGKSKPAADLTKCPVTLPFIARCCSGTKDGTKFDFWCLPNTF